MNHSVTGYVGLDVHAQSTAISLAQVGRTKPRFAGTVGATHSELTQALSQLGESMSRLDIHNDLSILIHLKSPVRWCSSLIRQKPARLHQ